jgi:hypothetical protein
VSLEEVVAVEREVESEGIPQSVEYERERFCLEAKGKRRI